MPSGAGRTHTAEAARRMGRSSTGAILAGRRHTASVQRHDATAADAIRARIREQGPIGFDTFMELALYGPGGFYERPPVGADGDFVTSPHVHPAFGMFVARALAPMRDALAPDGDLRLTEVGAGDGTLASQILGDVGPHPLHGRRDQRRRSCGARRARRRPVRRRAATAGRPCARARAAGQPPLPSGARRRRGDRRCGRRRAWSNGRGRSILTYGLRSTTNERTATSSSRPARSRSSIAWRHRSSAATPS